MSVMCYDMHMVFFQSMDDDTLSGWFALRGVWGIAKVIKAGAFCLSGYVS